MNIIAITQARYGSSRLPAKVLKEINGKTLLDIHLHRIKKSKMISEIIVATTFEDGAEYIIDIAKRCEVFYFQGSTNDVLDRFYNAIRDKNADIVVRITSDCPLIDPEEIDSVIEMFCEYNCDYASNTLTPSYPDGIDVEVFKFSALTRAFNEATLKSDREHVTPYIWRNSNYKGGTIFKSINIFNEKDFSDYRLTVDTEEDFLVIKHLIEAEGIDKSWINYVKFLDNNPEVKAINSSHLRNEGYIKSLKEDK